MADTSANLPENSEFSRFSLELDINTIREFILNTRDNLSLKSVANITILTLMGRLKLKNGRIKIGEFSIVKGRPQKKYLLVRKLVFGRKVIGEVCLGGEGEVINFTKNESLFVDTICNLSALLLKNIENIERLKDSNRKLNRKILQFESIFELSREMLFTSGVEKAAGICMNIIIGSLGIKEIAIEINDGGKQVFHKNLKKKDLKRKGLKKIKADYTVLYLGKKLNGRMPDQSDLHFAQIVLNLFYSNLENQKMIKALIEKERLEREVLIAREIQRKLLPENIPQFENLQIEADMITYYEVGGDYYDVIKLSDSELLIIIADVSGKGIPASLIMSAVQSSIKTMVLKGITDLSTIASTLNSLLIATTETNKFVALTFVKLNLNSDKLEYLNAGHIPPLLFSGKNILRLSEGGPIIGLLDFAKYKSATIEFKGGNVLFLGTDGLFEAIGKDGEEIGEKGIIAILKKCKNTHSIKECLKKWFLEESGKQINDDATFILIRK